MNVKTRVGWRQKKENSRLGGGRREEAAPFVDRPFMLRLPTEKGNRGAQGTYDSIPLSGVQAKHFGSQEELMEFVLWVLTEDEVALTQQVMGER